MQYTLVGNEDGTSNLTVFVAGTAPLTAHSTHPNFEAILEGVFADDESVIDLFDVSLTAGAKFERLSDRISVSNGRVYLDNEEVNNALTAQIVRFIQEGVEDWKPLVAFFENVSANPNEHSREQLYRWIEEQAITINDEGMLVGYKGVTTDGEGNLVSCTSGTAIADGVVVTGQIPNAVGTVVEMPRTEVMHNPKADCDAGLHVGSYQYANNYGPVMIEVEVNPRDVVSVPDASWKLRTCRYKVIQVLKRETETQGKPAYDTVLKPKKSLKQKVKDVVKRQPRKGDVYEDTDKRRAGRTVKVKLIDGPVALVADQSGKEGEIKVERLQSRKYKLVKRGR